MLSPRSMMALLAALALSAQAAESAIAAPPLCAAGDVGKGFCLTCKTKAKCVKAGAAPQAGANCTVAGEACTVLAGVAACKPIGETGCKCDKDNPKQCDAYDPNSLLVCLNGGITVSTKCGANGTCVNGACVTSDSPSQLCTGKNDVFVVLKPSCTSAVYCINGEPAEGLFSYPTGYFDMEAQNCMPFRNNSCPASGAGAYPDKSDYSKFYICSEGECLDEETCYEPTPDFDIISMECVGREKEYRTGNTECTCDPTTTEATMTTSVSTSTSTPVSSSTTTPVSSSTTTPASSSTTTPVSSSTTTPVSSSTTTPVSTSTTTPVSSSSTTPVSSSTTTPVSSSTTTPVSSSTTTTSRPAKCTAANVGQRYPYAENCKKYWSCRQVSSGVYEYVDSTCMGDLVFNANTTYCETQDNVPSCVIGK